jgi:hypothetical protein
MTFLEMITMKQCWRWRYSIYFHKLKMIFLKQKEFPRIERLCQNIFNFFSNTYFHRKIQSFSSPFYPNIYSGIVMFNFVWFHKYTLPRVLLSLLLLSVRFCSWDMWLRDTIISVGGQKLNCSSKGIDQKIKVLRRRIVVVTRQPQLSREHVDTPWN